MMYHGYTTFEECAEAVYFISPELAAFDKLELGDIDPKKTNPNFPSKSAAKLRIPVYKNYDPPKNPNEKPGLKQKAKPEEPSKPKTEPPKPSDKPV